MNEKKWFITQAVLFVIYLSMTMIFLVGWNQIMYSEELFRDEYDELADHLVAVNVKTNEIVGTYRLIHKDLLPAEWKFPTEKEFDISTLKNENIMEISRAVVKKEYRTGSTVILLWRGLMNYAISRGG